MEFRDYWDAIVRGWWLPVIFGLVGLAVGLVVASPPKGHIETHYQSTSVIGSPPTSQNGPSLLGGGMTHRPDPLLREHRRRHFPRPANFPASMSRCLRCGHRFRVVVPTQPGIRGQNTANENGVVNVSASGATPAAALALDKAFVEAMNTYTNDQAKSSLEAQEQADGGDALFGPDGHRGQQLRPGAHRSGSRGSGEHPADLPGESRDPAAGLRTPGGASALGRVHGRGRHGYTHRGRQPDVACTGRAS